MTTFEREEKFARGCQALAGLRDLLAGAAHGTTISSEKMASLVELIEADLRYGCSTQSMGSPIND